MEIESTASEPLLAQRYAWRRQLARGGSAMVHLAWDSVLERPVVVKLYGPSFLSSCGGQSAFSARGAAVEGLEHPAIAALHDYGRAQGTTFATYDFAPGESLEHRLANGPLTVAEVRRVVRRLSKALEGAHDAGVLHGQLAPSKVLFDAKGKAVLSGFAWGGETVAGRSSHSAYLSPQRRDGAAPTLGDDVYSLAALGLSMLIGSIMAGPEAIAPAIARLSAEAESVEMATVLSRALSRDPRERFTSARTFGDAFKAASDDVPGSWCLPPAETAAVSNLQQRERRRHVPGLTGPRIAAAGLAVVGLIGTSVLLLGSEAGAPTSQAPSADASAVAPGGNIASGRAASGAQGRPGGARTASPEKLPATSTAGAVTQAVAGARESGTTASATQALADFACADNGWKAFEAAGGTPLFPGEPACRRVFATNACPSPPVIAMIAPGSAADSRYVAWSEACGATEYWVEVEHADGSVQQQRVALDEGNAIELPDIKASDDVAISVIAFYDDPTVEWSHTVQLPSN